MSKELHIALQEAIGDLGTDVLKSPFLVNILQDYGALGQYDKGSKQITERLSELAKKGHIEQILSWRNLSKEQIQENGKSLLKKYDNTSYSQFTVNAILQSLEMPIVLIESSPVVPSPPKSKKTDTTMSSNDNSGVIWKVFLVIGGIALAVLLIWLVSEYFWWILIIGIILLLVL